jgi:endo-alpha-1,4-polygalactosaminidase (GH114 family)
MRDTERFAREAKWANVYHDSIRDKRWLDEVAIYPGRWAVNYSMLYLIVRILQLFKPERIIEFGLGESSKLISKFIDNELQNTKHLILEESKEWTENFTSRFTLSQNSEIMHMDIVRKKISGFNVNCYKDIEEKINEKFDLYIIDGPTALRHYSRYDICWLAEKFSPEDEFIIIMDDYNRKSEKRSVRDLLRILKKKNLPVHTWEYDGSKSQFLIATKKYCYAITL